MTAHHGPWRPMTALWARSGSSLKPDSKHSSAQTSDHVSGPVSLSLAASTLQNMFLGEIHMVSASCSGNIKSARSLSSRSIVMLHDCRHPFHPSFREQKSLYQQLHIWLRKRKRTKAPQKRFWLRLGMPESESQKSWEFMSQECCDVVRCMPMYAALARVHGGWNHDGGL